MRVSGFKDYCPIDYGTTRARLEPRGKKINISRVFYATQYNNGLNINLITLGEWRNLVDALDSKSNGSNAVRVRVSLRPPKK